MHKDSKTAHLAFYNIDSSGKKNIFQFRRLLFSPMYSPHFSSFKEDATYMRPMLIVQLELH